MISVILHQSHADVLKISAPYICILNLNVQLDSMVSQFNA